MSNLKALALALAFAFVGLAAHAQALFPPEGRPAVGIACAYESSLPTLLAGQMGLAQCDSSGRLIISPSASSGPAPASETATSSPGGVSSFSRITSVAAGTSTTAVKTSPGRVYKIIACNTTTTSYRIKFFNATISTVNAGGTAPLFTRPLPAAAASGGLNCASYDMSDIGWYFSTAITFALTAGAADTDTTALAAGAVTDLSVEYQ